MKCGHPNWMATQGPFLSYVLSFVGGWCVGFSNNNDAPAKVDFRVILSNFLNFSQNW